MLLNMKNALKKLRVWIIGVSLAILGVGVPFLILAITLNVDDAAAFQYPLLLGAFAAIYLLIGFVWGDLFTVSYRRKNKNWDGEVPPEIKEGSWSRSLPFYLASLTVFVVFMVFEVIFWITGGYPFL